jgi:hypothetical protein
MVGSFNRIIDTTRQVYWPCLQGGRCWNMSESGDESLTLPAVKLFPSPDGRSVLVCTEGSHMFMCNIAGSRLQVLTAMHGVVVDTFFVPCACWHPRGGHVYAADAGGRIQVCKPCPHTAPIHKTLVAVQTFVF